MVSYLRTMKSNDDHRALDLLLLVIVALASVGRGADQPQWGEAWSRNMASSESNLPASFEPRSGRNVKWSVELGTETHSSPVIAGGRVYLGTNNGHPRDPKHQGDRGVLMCFDENSGQLLWQLVVPKRDEDIYFDWPQSGISSPATVEGDRVYIVSNRGEVMCLDARGLADGNQGSFQDESAHMTPKKLDPAASTPEVPLTPGAMDADILWLFDLTKGAGIWSHDAAHSSILIHGDYLYLNTGTGVDNTHKRIRAPNAPSLVVLNKHTGRLVARDYEGIAPNIFHSTWCSPSLAQINGRPLLFFAGGNGIVYAFETLSKGVMEGGKGEVLENSANGQLSDTTIVPPPPLLMPHPFALQSRWYFDFDPAAPKTNVHRFNSNRRESPSNIYGMPVFYRNRLYVAGGGDIWWGKNEAWLKCIDVTKTGDISSNGVVWVYPLRKHVLATPAISDGLLFIGDCGRVLHCIDAETGKACWTHELEGEVWASALAADGKVYLGTRAGKFYIFEATRQKQLLSMIDLGTPISSTCTAANGVLYVATMTRLYAVRSETN
jgi:outer membrane protein assembly factor BamB